MTDDRRLDVLRAIVQDYVETREPVGSRALAQRHHLGVSPATIRNDMAALEEEGLIAQPHTSAGRVPTDKGYRLFVDRLASVKPLSAAERRAIQTLLDGANDLDDIVDRTVRLLAQLTRQVAIVQYPSLRRSVVRHIELVPVGDRRLLVVVISDTGRVEQRFLDWPGGLELDVIGELRARVNAVTIGAQLPAMGSRLVGIETAFAPEQRPLVTAVCELLSEAFGGEVEERVVLAGTANLARADLDFPRTITPVLDAIEEQVVLLRLLQEMADDAAGVSVRIGSENRELGLAETSFIGTGYGAGGDVVARLGVLGPTRMDYPTSIAAVRAVARYVSRILAG